MTQRFYTEQRLNEALQEFNPGTYRAPLDTIGQTSLPPAIGATTLGVTNAAAISRPVGPDLVRPGAPTGLHPLTITLMAGALLLLMPMGL